LDGVLAEQDGGSAEWGVHGAERVAGMEVLAFSEWVVAGQDELAVDMAWLSGDEECGAVIGDAVVGFGETEKHGGISGGVDSRSLAGAGRWQ